MARSKSNTTVKRYIKFLSICKNPREIKTIISNCPDEVLKAISDASLNALKGDIKLSTAQKKLFKRHRALLEKLARKSPSIKSKRAAIQKGGVLPLIPILLSTVLGSLGSLLFSN